MRSSCRLRTTVIRERTRFNSRRHPFLTVRKRSAGEPRCWWRKGEPFCGWRFRCNLGKTYLAHQGGRGKFEIGRILHLKSRNPKWQIGHARALELARGSPTQEG